MTRNLAKVVPLFALALATSATGQARSTQPLTVDALTSLNALSVLWSIGALSPDGKWLACSVKAGGQAASEGGGEDQTGTGMSAAYASGTDLWLTDTKTGTSTRITDGKGRVEEPAWSPDGSKLAFYSDRDGVGRIRIWEAATKQLRKVSDAKIKPSAYFEAHLRWTPDGQYVIALLEPEQANAAAATPSGAATASATKDSTVVPGATVRVYRVREKGDAAVGATATGGLDTITIDSTIRHTRLFADLSLVRIADGTVRRLAKHRAIMWYDVSPDGQWLGLSQPTGRYPGAQQSLYDFEIVSINDGSAKTVAHHSRNSYGVGTFSPDSRMLAIMSFGSMANGDVHIVDIAAGKARRVTTTPHERIDPDDPWRAYWAPDSKTVFVTAKGKLWRQRLDSQALELVIPETWDRQVVQIVSNASLGGIWTRDSGRTFTIATRNPETKDEGFYRVDATSGAVTKLREENRRYAMRYNFLPLTSADGSTIVYLAEDAQHPPDLWASGADLKDSRAVTNLNPALSALSFGATRVIDYPGNKGQRLKAVLLLPSDYHEGQRYPTLVRVYPGPFTQSDRVNRFGIDGLDGIGNLQMLATRGYAVLMPEVPQDMGTPMRDLVEGVNLAVNKAIEIGVADPNRLGVFGQSYGGYSTISIVTQTTRFKAALMSAGLGDLVGNYLAFHPESGGDGVSWSEGGQGLMGGTPWQFRERYLANSPVMYLDRVRTPLMIIHGEKDDAVQVQFGDQIFVGLRRLGREVEYRRYAGEGHAISHKENLTDYWTAALRWFDGYVKNAKAEQIAP